jgi:hypothetical protein
MGIKSLPVARDLEKKIEDSAVLVKGFRKYIRKNHPEIILPPATPTLTNPSLN